MQTTMEAGHARSRSNAAHPTHYDRVLERIESLTYPGVVAPDGIGPGTIRRWLTLFSVEEVLAGVDESFAITVKSGPDGLDLRSVQRAFHKVPSVIERLRAEETKPYIGRLLYIQGIIRRKLGWNSYKAFDHLERLHVEDGHSLISLETAAKGMRDWMGADEEPLSYWFNEFRGRL